MSVAPGYVYDIELPHAEVGPWKAGRHPGLILGATASSVTLVPMSTSAPRGHEERALGVEIRDGGGVVSTPIWAHCHILTTIDPAQLRQRTPRGLLPKAELGPIRDRVARYLKLDL